MNETLRVIQSRRSIRKYKPEPITDTELQAILQAAVYAPSAGNRQPWHFTVVCDPALMTRLKKTLKENLLKCGAEFLAKRASESGFIAFHDAPMLIIISADEKAGFSSIDCGAAAQNIALAAESLNIGTCIMTSSGFLFLEDADGQLKKALGIPDGYRHVCVVTLGYKDCEQPTPTPRKEGLINNI
jgi:nitroreductase